MFSNRKISLFFTFVLALNSACSMRFRDQTPPVTSIKLGSSSEAGCLTGYKQKISSYFSGNLGEKDLNDFWDCADKSIDLFSTRTRGVRKSEYLVTELTGFIETYFMSGEKLPKGLVAELMVLKKIFVGGDIESLTRDDLVRFRKLLKSVKAQTLLLRPFMPITPSEASKRDHKQIDLLTKNLKIAMEALASEFTETQESYSFQHLEKLLTELQSGIESYCPLIQGLENLLISDTEDAITPKDWNRIFKTAANLYSAYLKYKGLQAKNLGWASGAGLERLVDLFTDLMGTLKEIVESQPSQTIAFNRLDRFIDVFGDNGIHDFFDLDIKADHIKGIIRPLFRRFLAFDNFDIKIRKANGLVPDLFDGLSAQFNEWILIQTWNDSLRKKYGADFFLDESIRKELKASLESETSPILKDWISYIISVPAFHTENRYTMTFASSVQTAGQNFHELTFLGIKRVAAKMVLKSYATDQKRSTEMQGVTKDELDQIHWDFRQIGLDLALFDPRSIDSFRKRFDEANLFSYTGNSDSLLDLNEATNLIDLIFSSFFIAKEIKDDANETAKKGICKSVGEDAAHVVKLESTCYRKIFYEKFPKYFEKSMPYFSELFNSLDEDGKQNFLFNIEAAGRFYGYSEQPFEGMDYEGIVGMVHYIEMVYVRFDKDASQTIGTEEALRDALPIFQSKIAEIKEFNTERGYQAIFSYLLTFGRTPSQNVGGLASWLRFRVRKYWYFEADRAKLVAILALIQGGSK